MWKTAPRTCEVGFVREYYEALSRGDIDSVIDMWAEPKKMPRENLEKTLRNVASVTIRDIQIAQHSTYTTSVNADVTEHHKNQQPAAKWSVVVTLLRKENDAWKIDTIKYR
jgi:ketosteroid isomerase-like protein